MARTKRESPKDSLRKGNLPKAAAVRTAQYDEGAHERAATKQVGGNMRRRKNSRGYGEDAVTSEG